MITGELKHKIDSLWEMFWTGGLTNPLDVVEQMTYLMFIRDLDDTDRLRAKEAAMLGLPHESIFAGTVKIGEREVEGDLLRWSKFQDIGAEQMYETVQTLVFPFIKGLHGNKESAYSKYMDDAIFKLPTPLLLSKVGGWAERDLSPHGPESRQRYAGGYLRISALQDRPVRRERTVPHPAAHHPHDGRADGPPAH